MAALAVDTLVKNVGRMMAKLHGYPDYPYVVIPAPFVEGVMISDQMFEEKVNAALAKTEQLLLTGTMS